MNHVMTFRQLQHEEPFVRSLKHAPQFAFDVTDNRSLLNQVVFHFVLQYKESNSSFMTSGGG